MPNSINSFNLPSLYHRLIVDSLSCKSGCPLLIVNWLGTGVTRYDLWIDYRGQQPNGYQYTQFCHHYRQWHQTQQVTMHFEHKAGDKVFVDFAGKRLSMVDEASGELKPVEFFVAVLGCSQLTYAQAVASQRTEDFIEALQNALRYFGGVPAAIVPDNLKAAVIRADRYEPQINETLSDFALHYQTTILPPVVASPVTRRWWKEPSISSTIGCMLRFGTGISPVGRTECGYPRTESMPTIRCCLAAKNTADELVLMPMSKGNSSHCPQLFIRSSTIWWLVCRKTAMCYSRKTSIITVFPTATRASEFDSSIRKAQLRSMPTMNALPSINEIGVSITTRPPKSICPVLSNG
jgi:hypothetical protein